MHSPGQPARPGHAPSAQATRAPRAQRQPAAHRAPAPRLSRSSRLRPACRAPRLPCALRACRSLLRTPARPLRLSARPAHARAVLARPSACCTPTATPTPAPTCAPRARPARCPAALPFYRNTILYCDTIFLLQPFQPQYNPFVLQYHSSQPAIRTSVLQYTSSTLQPLSHNTKYCIGIQTTL